ncbi:MAG: zinc ribbon domain-containing protein [Spirochaetia bacterium]|jgi:putative FmdB family regulatory protein|nr:zinc ribbon domain-containing protein [Spirochaetia bacterium]
MPTYDYECKTCGKIFEVFQKMSDDPLTECPECGKEVKRLVGGGLGIIFKGSGFYVTDNKKVSSSESSSSSGKNSSSSSSAGSDSNSGGASKKETVPSPSSSGTGTKKE